MSISEGIMKIIEELEFLTAERRQLKVRGPHFRIIHRYRQQFSPCSAHEEIGAVYLVHAGQQFQVRLGTTLAAMFDFLGRHNQFAQTATQIERGTRTDHLHGHRHTSTFIGKNGAGVPRRYVRVYIDRIRVALRGALLQAKLDIEPNAILISEETATNETGYRLRGTFEWLHTAE